jgi:Protein phosphatase 2C
MTACRWTWAAARSVGTSHLRSKKGCDDFAACLELRTPRDSILVAVASDGAGTAQHSSIGSRITSRVFAELATGYIRADQSLSSFSIELAREWLDEIRDRIIAAAANRHAVPRDFASTLVGSVISDQEAIFIHVGDGAAVFRTANHADWRVPTWPAQGEYAATTYFVTDDPQPSVQFCLVNDRITEIAVFSDGLERLVLDFSSHTAHAPFFDKMFAPFGSALAGRNRTLSRALQRFLDGPSVCDKTDDDKTLILAKRVQN